MPKVPFGYYLVEQPWRAEVMQAMWGLHDEGYSNRYIAKVLTKHFGIEISFATVQRTTRRWKEINESRLRNFCVYGDNLRGR